LEAVTIVDLTVSIFYVFQITDLTINFELQIDHIADLVISIEIVQIADLTVPGIPGQLVTLPQAGHTDQQTSLTLTVTIVLTLISS